MFAFKHYGGSSCTSKIKAIYSDEKRLGVFPFSKRLGPRITLQSLTQQPLLCRFLRECRAACRRRCQL